MSDTYGLKPPGYRLPEAVRLGPVHLQIADLGRSIDYYRDVLGLSVYDRTSASAVLGAAGSGEPLVLLEQVPGTRAIPPRGRLGLYHFAILLPGRGHLGRFVDHLGRNGIRAGMSDHLVSEAIYLQDPDGLGIEVYADRPRNTWRAERGQLVMATNPLDVQSLVQAGGQLPWTGAPEGTTMGHVHLYVGDLAASEQFYHRGLGFDKTVWSYPGALFLSAGGYHHHLGTNTWAAGAASPTEHDAQLRQWTLVLPDAEEVDAAARSLAAGGGIVVKKPDGALATDPWGTRVMLTHD
jgi:catechol 2,3-dioxygenase